MGKSKIYEPEIGQACFGQPWQSFEPNSDVMCALECLANAWYVYKDTDNPFSNTGYYYDGNIFCVHAYSWNGDEEQKWNFKWKDIRISWYKHMRRGTTINRDMDKKEIKEMLTECLREMIKGY